MLRNSFPPGIPVIPMVNVLAQYAYAKELPFNPHNWESIVRTFNHYQIHTSLKN